MGLTRYYAIPAALVLLVASPVSAHVPAECGHFVFDIQVAADRWIQEGSYVHGSIVVTLDEIPHLSESELAHEYLDLTDKLGPLFEAQNAMIVAVANTVDCTNGD